MDILFKTERMRTEFNDSRRLIKRHGDARAKLIRRRLDDLRAANSLDDLRSTPGRCHELKGDRDEQLSIDLDGPYRLIFEAAEDPAPRKPDGGLDWKGISTIRILEVTNTHE